MLETRVEMFTEDAEKNFFNHKMKLGTFFGLVEMAKKSSSAMTNEFVLIENGEVVGYVFEREVH